MSNTEGDSDPKESEQDGLTSRPETEIALAVQG